MKPRKKMYLFDPSVKWKAFKKIQDMHLKASKETGPYPMNIDKNLWQMVKQKAILVGFTEKPFDMFVMTKWPTDYEVYMIRNI